MEGSGETWLLRVVIYEVLKSIVFPEKPAEIIATKGALVPLKHLVLG